MQYADPKVGDLLQAGVIGSDSQEKVEDINELIVGKASSVIREYIENLNFIWFRGWEGYSPIKFIRYLPGQEMTVHCDLIHSMFDGVRKGIPILSMIGHLNDDYEGGETYFFDDKNGEKVDTKQGDLLIFPSSFLFPHYVTPVTKGVRYSYVSWVW
jgi:predicted 2-oxoglutarate/Fe(II)-dependent dioxygenase YbiX